MSARLPILGLVSHQRKVMSLYKRAARNLESWLPDRAEFRYEVTLLRARFDANKNEPDMRKADQLLKDGEKELFSKLHPIPMKFPDSPGGCAYGRHFTPPDWILDYWDPIEKASYPEYFARREERKKEFVVWWHKQYGKPKPEDKH